jgi:hypothetical protein
MSDQRRPIASQLGLIALCVIVVVRLWMTADRDILALNQPYDDYWFIFTARRTIWGGHYTNLSFAQLQMFALWLEGVCAIGVPARLGLDLWWLGGAAYLAFAIRRLCANTWPAVLLFVFLAFHPYSIALFDRALSENLMASLVTIALAAFVDVWNFRVDGPRPSTYRQRLSIAVGALAFAAAYHTRKEGIVLLAPLGFLALWSLVHRTLWWGRARGALGIGIIAIPLIATIAVGLVISARNFEQWGIFARYELAAPGYGRAIQALNAIDPQGPTPKWVTVTAATRARAYEVSPTFRELKPFLDGPMTAVVLAQTKLNSGVEGEIGNGWFYWTLRDAASLAGWHVDARTAEAHYNAMADEIDRAFERGTLPRRLVLIPFVDPDWHKWLPLLPGALAGELRATLAPVPGDLVEPMEDATTDQQGNYVVIAARRRPFGAHAISGWLIAPPGTRVAITAGDRPGPFTVLEGITRPDVPGAFPFQLHTDAAGGAPSFEVITPDGTTRRIAFNALQVGKVNKISDMPTLTLGVDSLSADRPPPRANRWLGLICRAWSIVGWVALAVGLLAVVWVGDNESSAEVATRLVLVLAILGIGSRVALLALLDSSSWSGTQARYLLPAVPMLALFGALGAWKIAQRIGRIGPVRDTATEG